LDVQEFAPLMHEDQPLNLNYFLNNDLFTRAWYGLHTSLDKYSYSFFICTLSYTIYFVSFTFLLP